MNYKALEKAWTKRRGASSTTKAMFNSALVMRKADNGDFTFYRKEHKYERTSNNGWVKLPVVENLWATVTPDSIATFHYHNGGQDNQAKNLAFKLAGISLYSDTGRFKNYEHKTRVSIRESYKGAPVTYPFGAGFKFDVINRTILWCPEDVKMVTNKEAAKPIIQYVRDVMKVMEVMHRIGAFDKSDKEKRDGWYVRRSKLETAAVFDMTEDTMALLAEYAYTEAEAITQRVQSSYGTWVMDAKGNENYVRTDRNPQEVQAEYWAKLKKNAALRLRAYLKAKHGAYDKINVTN